MKDHRSEFAEFYRQANNECLTAVLVIVGDRDTAQELVAEPFSRAWASWRTVSRHPAPKAWVIRTALNANVSRWRRRRREVPLFEEVASVAVSVRWTLVVRRRRWILEVRAKQV
jgi:DNA-directed RNA polymerase specialized sigma24 family protein